MPGLGRNASPHDPRDHPLAKYVPRLLSVTEALPRRVPFLEQPIVLNQGDTPKCVGYGDGHQRAMAERRDEHRRLVFDADELYARCKERDGEPNEEGTYPRVANDILLERGMLVKESRDPSEIGKARGISGYARLASPEEIKAAVVLFGFAGLGGPWYWSWFEPNAAGVLPSPDTIAGGHWWTIGGYNDDKILRTRGRTTIGAWACLNTWGRSWGRHGRFWLPYEYVPSGALDPRDNEWEAWKTIDRIGDVA